MNDINILFFEGQCKREQSQARLGSAEPKKQREQRANAFAFCRVASEEDVSQCSLTSIFYQLIRVAIGTQDMLSRAPSAAEWAELYAMAKKQSLVGICFASLQKLYNFDNQEPNTNNPQPDLIHNQEPITNNLDEVQYLKWMGMAAKIQQRNEVVNKQCIELVESLKLRGYRSCILKGQGIAALYKLYDRLDAGGGYQLYR